MAQRGDTVEIKISAKSLRARFNGCEPDYIATVCHGACCRSSKGNALVAVHADEQQHIESRGCTVTNGMIDAGEKCPFQTESHLCGIHEAGKPFGCTVSPFKINKNGTLIIRHRYYVLKCFNDGKRIPAYVAFRASLVALFGEQETERIAAHLEKGGDDMNATMSRSRYEWAQENDSARQPKDE